MKCQYIYIQTIGGCGYALSLARFIARLDKRKYRIAVMSPYWDVYKASQAAGYCWQYYTEQEGREFLDDCEYNDGKLVLGRLYDLQGFVEKKLNYQSAWAQFLGIPAADVGEMPEEFLAPVKAFPSIADDVQRVLDEAGDEFALIQFQGGQSPLDYDPSVPFDVENEPLKRAYPYGQEFVDEYLREYPGRKIIQYCLENEKQLDGCLRFSIPYLSYYEISKHAKEAILVDSSLQHLITGNCPCTVLWAHTHPDHFGYRRNRNIVFPCNRERIRYFSLCGPAYNKVSFPSGEELLREIEPSPKRLRENRQGEEND